jgi:hypothetical protein
MRAAVQTQRILLRLQRERHLREVGGRIAAAASAPTAFAWRGSATTRCPRCAADHQLVDAPRLLVEERGLTGEAERTVQRAVLLVRRDEAIDVDADIVNDRAGVLVVAAPRFDVERAAVQVVLSQNQSFGASLGQPLAVLQGRLLRLSTQIKF